MSAETKTQEFERRFFSVALRDGGMENEVDAGNNSGTANEGGTPPRIEGYAAVFNSMSEDLGGFREMMEPGFFDDVMGDDVRALFNHDRNFVLGRSAAGTLVISQNNQGLLVDITPPDTTLVNDMVLTPMQRGDINQMSFAFSVKPGGDEWREENGQLMRILKKGGAEHLFDVSVVTEPAYPETCASVRSKVSEYQQKAEPAKCPETEAGSGEGVNPQERVNSYRRRLAVAG